VKRTGKGSAEKGRKKKKKKERSPTRPTRRPGRRSVEKKKILKRTGDGKKGEEDEEDGLNCLSTP